MRTSQFEKAAQAVSGWDSERRAEYWEASARLYREVSESYEHKAAALDKILSAWGMTWDEYQQKGSPCLDG